MRQPVLVDPADLGGGVVQQAADAITCTRVGTRIGAEWILLGNMDAKQVQAFHLPCAVWIILWPGVEHVSAACHGDKGVASTNGLIKTMDCSNQGQNQTSNGSPSHRA